MKILYIVALLSFAALAGVAYAITRHVRKNAAAAKTNPAKDLELSNALDARLSGISRTERATSKHPAGSIDVQPKPQDTGASPDDASPETMSGPLSSRSDDRP
jgi:hypothetical protein